jgi:hypothetical protein
MKNIALIVSIGIFLFTAPVFADGGDSDKTEVQDKKVGLNIGDIAPELKFKNPEGKEISLSSLKGKILV